MFLKKKFESIPDNIKRVLLMFLNKNDDDIVKECGFLENDFNRQSLEFKKILLYQTEEYLDYIENDEKSIIKIILSKQNDINRPGLEI